MLIVLVDIINHPRFSLKPPSEMYSPLLYLLVVLTAMSFAQEQDWTKNCSKCSCMWVGGRKSANCTHRNLDRIPQDLSDQLRDIDFSNNPLYHLGKDLFLEANMRDIHKLKLQNCSIESMDETAFRRLALMIELDLSRNNIEVLPRTIFHDTIKLRILYLRYNKIQNLEEGLFENTTSLRQIYLEYNQIETISERSFSNLKSLNHLSLGYNRLRNVAFDLKESLPKLNSLNLEGNPWKCDCNLEKFRHSVVKNNLITTPTICNEPAYVKGKSWTDRVTFACSPVIVSPEQSSKVEAVDSNVTLTCKVTGEPTPDVDWTSNGLIIEKDPRKNRQKYYTSKSTDGGFTWNNLTITNVNFRDQGDYKCIAKNPGGEDARNVSLVIPVGVLGGGSVGGALGTSGVLIISLSVGLVVLLIVILVLVCVFCRKNGVALGNKRRDLSGSSEECINMRGQLEIKKGLITEVNPVSKPPRSGVPPSIVSGATEVSDVKRNLLDNDSVFDCDDESRSLDFDQPLLRKSQMLLDPDYHRLHNPYPPDLLPFPPRNTQVSPAGSSASTVADTTRLPPHHGPQSPLASPIYDHLSSVYRTLPYSRSHSPFVGAPIPRIPRQGAGYVTIPRRPRQQSWSSEPPPVNDAVLEPLYDNLGIRSSASGNCSGGETPASTPRSNRMFPMSPPAIDPIAETHETGGPIAKPEEIQHKKPMTSQTLPRSLGSNKLTPSRTQWAMANAEALRSPEKSPSSSEGKPIKIPPRPPPKPKKRASTGPLFEDEGEDGTEV